MKNTSLLALVLPVLAASVPTAGASAQTQSHLIGITRFVPLLRHQDHASCSQIGQCALAGMPNSVGLPGFVGGTGWDPKRSGAWVSNGTALAYYNDNCDVGCAPMAIPTLAAGAFITGIEVVVGKDEVWLIDSTGTLHFYTNSCPPMPLGTCNTGLAPTAIGNVTTGLAVDEGNGFAFVAYAQFPAGPNQVAVIPLAAPCAPTAMLNTPPCPTIGPIRPYLGLACDWGNQILYATDGSGTTAINYLAGGATVNFTGSTCCGPGPIVEPMIGLALRPGGATSTGSTCANGPCAPCPMTHTLRNDPLVGNAQFRLGLDQAASNSFSFCLIGGGPCINVAPVAPPLCGPILTSNYLGYLGAVFTGGGTTFCGGSADFLLPIPPTPALANALFSSQCLNVCFSSVALGTSLSECLTWQIQGH